MSIDDAILQHLRSKSLSDQSQLLELLKQEGFDLTLSTLCRRMKKLGVRKIRGIYSEAAPSRPLSGPVTIRKVEPCLLIMKTNVGSAQALAVAMDAAGLPSLAGTVAGYDTIFAASITPSRLSTLESEIRKFLEQ